MRRVALVLSLGSMVCALVVAAAASTLHAAELGPEHLVRSEHLQVRGVVDEALVSRAAELGEALYVHLTAHFGREPDAASLPLTLTLHPTPDAFWREIARRGTYLSTKDIGGYTWFGRGGSHVAVQKHEFDTRRLIVHELTHQFHFGCRPPYRRGRGPAWYREGLAEYFGWHRRTKDGFQFGVLDVVAPTRRAHNARRLTRRSSWDPTAFTGGASKSDYVDALAIVAGLLGSDDKALRGKFREWERWVLRRGGETRKFKEMFPDGDVIKAALRATWQAHGPKWGPAPAGWDESRDGWITGVPARWAALGRRFQNRDGSVRIQLKPEGASRSRMLILGGKYTLVEWKDGTVAILGGDAVSFPAPTGAAVDVTAEGTLVLYGNPEGTGKALARRSGTTSGRWDLRLFVRSGRTAFRLGTPPAPAPR